MKESLSIRRIGVDDDGKIPGIRSTLTDKIPRMG